MRERPPLHCIMHVRAWAMRDVALPTRRLAMKNVFAAADAQMLRCAAGEKYAACIRFAFLYTRVYYIYYNILR